jgi:hypothetical protein
LPALQRPLIAVITIPICLKFNKAAYLYAQ